MVHTSNPSCLRGWQEDCKFKASQGNLVRACLKIKPKLGRGAVHVTEQVEHSPSMHEALGSVPSTSTTTNRSCRVGFQFREIEVTPVSYPTHLSGQGAELFDEFQPHASQTGCTQVTGDSFQCRLWLRKSGPAWESACLTTSRACGCCQEPSPALCTCEQLSQGCPVILASSLALEPPFPGVSESGQDFPRCMVSYAKSFSGKRGEKLNP